MPPDRSLPAPLLLASASTTRARLLREAGVDLDVANAGIDEDAVRASCRAAGAGVEETAIRLAEMKALAASRRVMGREPGRYVLGADQMLECDGTWFDKPADRDAARAQLLALRGRRHHLVSAAVLALDGERIWHQADRAELVMRDFSTDFLERYLELAGEAACASVGAYQLEGVGAQLFSRVRGDFFTILGLPLLPVLAILRQHGMLPS